jgi:UDP-glucuronate decarboxylase
MSNRNQILANDAKSVCQAVDLNSLKHAKILLTGASGLLGLHFLASLRYAQKVQGIEMQLTALAFSPPDALLQELAGEDFCELLQGDLTDSQFLESLEEFDVIIHAAGYGQPGRFTVDPIRTLELNTSVTLNLAKKLKQGGRFLFTSSAEVYTGLSMPPFSEDRIGTTNTEHPRSCYIEGKRTGEAIGFALRKMGINFKSVRIALTYGPGTRDGDTRVVGMIIAKALKGEIQLIDSGSARRSMLYVSDAMVMLWNILLYGKQGLYNVGGKTEISILELAQRIGKQLSVSVIKSNEESLAGAPEQVRLDMRRFENEFKYRECIDLDRGLAQTIQWQREGNKL